MSLQKRYPGVKPFETTEKELFFGRDQDIQDLYDLVYLEPLVVLFGKSGYGKSSLINAGLIPRLTESGEDSMLPLVVRMRTHTQGEASPLKKVQLALDASLSLKEEEIPKDFEELWQERGGADSLWYQVKRRQKEESEPLVLIFDQFEEFFTYPAAEQIRFRQELSELLYAELPRNLRSDWRSIDRTTRTFLSQKLEVKVLFAIREDKLSLLNSLREELPQILTKRYELKALTKNQASAAIEEPARLPQAQRFAAKDFRYAPEALKRLLEELSQTYQQDLYQVLPTLRIESFLLQICCEYIERQALEKGLSKIEVQDLPNFDNIYSAYYEGKMQELPEEQQGIAQTLMEQGLLYYDAGSDEARRLSVDRDQLLLNYQQEGLDATLLELLKDKFLIREEPNSVGGFSYEISHDTLLAPILKARKLREEAAQRKAYRRRVQRWAFLGVLGVAVIAGLIALTVWAFKQKAKADALAEELEDQIENLEKQIYITDKLEFDQLERSISIYIKAEERGLAREALIDMDSIALRYPDSLFLQQSVEELKQQIIP